MQVQESMIRNGQCWEIPFDVEFIRRFRILEHKRSGTWGWFFVLGIGLGLVLSLIVL